MAPSPARWAGRCTPSGGVPERLRGVSPGGVGGQEGLPRRRAQRRDRGAQAFKRRTMILVPVQSLALRDKTTRGGSRACVAASSASGVSRARANMTGGSRRFSGEAAQMKVASDSMARVSPRGVRIAAPRVPPEPASSRGSLARLRASGWRSCRPGGATAAGREARWHASSWLSATQRVPGASGAARRVAKRGSGF